MKTSTKQATKTVVIIARIQFKSDARKVVYIVRSSDGTKTYQTYLLNGKATGCQCPSRKPCYHGLHLEQIEAARVASYDKSYKDAVAETLNAFYSERAEQLDPMVNAIRGGRIVEVRWSTLSESERCEANASFA